MSTKTYYVPVIFQFSGEVKILAEDEANLKAKLQSPEFMNLAVFPENMDFLKKSYEIALEGCISDKEGNKVIL